MANLKRKKRKKLLIFSTLGVVLAVGIWFGFLRKPAPLITVQTEKVSRRNLTELVTANGKIQPVVFVKISPEVSGEITELPVKEGDEIKKGDLLLKIKPDVYIAGKNVAEAMYKSAQAQTDLAKANLEKADLELKRNEDLFKAKLISDSQYLEVKTGYDVAKATFESAKHQAENSKANLDQAIEYLSKTTICSPLAGTISKLNSQAGERVVGTAAYQGTEVMTIADLTDMEARVDVGEIDVVLIKEGQKARLEVDAFRDRRFEGVVTEIANTAKTQNAGSQQEATKFEVRIRVQEKESFRPGMTVTAQVETRSRTNVLSVPIQSVTTRMPKEPGDKKAPPKTKMASLAPASSTTDDKASNKTTAKTAATSNETAQSPSPTNSADKSAETGTNTTTAKKRPNEAPKPIEVVFLAEDGKAKMVQVKRGISDDDYVEICEGLTEGQEVVSGGYKAINRELEDGKKIKVDNNKRPMGKEESDQDKGGSK
jgi:HlyD family secretion protein